MVACHRVGSTDRIIVKLLKGKDAMKLLENKNGNSSEGNDDYNLCGDHVSVSEQVKDRKNFGCKNSKYSQIRVFAFSIQCSVVELKNWLERVW